MQARLPHLQAHLSSQRGGEGLQMHAGRWPSDTAADKIISPPHVEQEARLEPMALVSLRKQKVSELPQQVFNQSLTGNPCWDGKLSDWKPVSQEEI